MWLVSLSEEVRKRDLFTVESHSFQIQKSAWVLHPFSFRSPYFHSNTVQDRVFFFKSFFCVNQPRIQKKEKDLRVYEVQDRKEAGLVLKCTSNEMGRANPQYFCFQCYTKTFRHSNAMCWIITQWVSSRFSDSSSTWQHNIPNSQWFNIKFHGQILNCGDDSSCQYSDFFDNVDP